MMINNIKRNFKYLYFRDFIIWVFVSRCLVLTVWKTLESCLFCSSFFHYQRSGCEHLGYGKGHRNSHGHETWEQDLVKHCNSTTAFFRSHDPEKSDGETMVGGVCWESVFRESWIIWGTWSILGGKRLFSVLWLNVHMVRSGGVWFRAPVDAPIGQWLVLYETCRLQVAGSCVVICCLYISIGGCSCLLPFNRIPEVMIGYHLAYDASLKVPRRKTMWGSLVDFSFCI